MENLVDDRWQYLALLVGCIVVTFPLELIYGFRVWRNPARLIRAIGPGLVVFVLWDLWSIGRGHWEYSARYTTGWELFEGFPIEELLFFIVIPTAAISSLEAVRAGLERRGQRA